MAQISRREFIYQALCLTLAACTKGKERKMGAIEHIPERAVQEMAPIIQADPLVIAEESPTELEKKIEREDGYLRTKKFGRYCRMHERENLDKDENTSWLVYDLNAEREIVSINADVPRQSASMFKPFVGLANYDALESGQLKLTYKEVFNDLMELMLRYSDNVATTLLMRLAADPSTQEFLITQRKKIRRTLRWRSKLPDKLIGSLKEDSPKKVQAILNKYPIFHQTNIVEELDRAGRTYKNWASARDYSRFLQALWKGELPGSKELLRFMGLRNYDRIKRYTAIPERVKIYDKTGTTGRLCGNMGILDDNGRAWIFVGILERPAPLKKWQYYQKKARENVIRHMSETTYRWLKKE